LLSEDQGHNVDIIGVGPDSAISANIGNNPPGWDNTITDGAGNSIANGEADWSIQLTCAGAYGCHGDHSISGNDAGIQGAHHGNPGTDSLITNPTAVGNSYRFCDRIKGKEDATWNWEESATQHNEYAGSTYNDGGALDKGTISFLCGECHGDYHTTEGIGGTSSPWLRHPTDILLDRGSGTEYSGYNQQDPGANTYNIQAPVARPVVDGSSPTNVVDVDDNTNSDGAIIMCLSCHRAHGSNQPDILRWDYDGVIAGGGSSNEGCFVCHTTKDTP
jgi:predicted CXXCH cytochrome family protein